MNPRHPSYRTLTALVALSVACSGLLLGCTSPAAPEPPTGAGTGSAQAVGAQPQPAVLSTPNDAVRSYLDWVSYAYRVGISDVASHTMTPDEGVRVDSYLQYNLTEQDRRIDQRIVGFAVRNQSQETTSATLAAREKWRYAYLSRDGRRSTSPTYTASYETTYTLVRTAKGWVVDSVEAAPLGDVK